MIYLIALNMFCDMYIIHAVCADFQFLLINMVIIIGSPKPVIVSQASETHCGPAKIDFG